MWNMECDLPVQLKGERFQGRNGGVERLEQRLISDSLIKRQRHRLAVIVVIGSDGKRRRRTAGPS